MSLELHKTHAAFTFERRRFEAIDPLAVTEPVLPRIGSSMAFKRARSIATWLSIPRSLRPLLHPEPTRPADDIPIMVDVHDWDERRVALSHAQQCPVIRLKGPRSVPASFFLA